MRIHTAKLVGPFQQFNTGSACQSSSQLAVAAVFILSHRMQERERPFERSWLREVPRKLVKELAKVPLERSKAGAFGDSGRDSLTSSGVPMRIVKELAKTPLQRIYAGVI